MPRKPAQQPNAVAQDTPAAEGRAVIPAPDGGLVLPADQRVLHTVHNPYTEAHELIIAGPGLPPWQRGDQPARFSSYGALGAYVNGDRSEVSSEPA